MIDKAVQRVDSEPVAFFYSLTLANIHKNFIGAGCSQLLFKQFDDGANRNRIRRNESSIRVFLLCRKFCFWGKISALYFGIFFEIGISAGSYHHARVSISQKRALFWGKKLHVWSDPSHLVLKSYIQIISPCRLDPKSTGM